MYLKAKGREMYESTYLRRFRSKFIYQRSAVVVAGNSGRPEEFQEVLDLKDSATDVSQVNEIGMGLEILSRYLVTMREETTRAGR